MTEKLASRIAGLKLGGIVAVLLIPMFVLSYFLMQSLRHEIQFTERELEGVAFIKTARPILLGAAHGKIDEPDLVRFRHEGKALAKSLGVEKELAAALATINSTGSDKRFAMPQLQAMFASAAAKSNIILDPYAETYYLGSVVSVHVPDLLRDYAETWTAQSQALRDAALSQAETVNILTSLGGWRESLERLTEAYEAGKLAAGDQSAYLKLGGHFSEMASHPERTERLFSTSQPAQLAANLAALPEFGEQSLHIIGNIDGVWTAAIQRLEGLLSNRLYNLNVQLTLMLAMAISVCLVGSGAAALMFRNTLHELDTVQAARNDAERSRVEAQTYASEVQKISDDVTRLNVELSNNLKMLREAQDDSIRKGKLAHLGQLTATVAHELRNPLGAVRTSTFLLERKLKGKGLGIEAQLERINNGVTRCDNIISQLLDFARTKSLQIETLDVDTWLARLVEDEAEKLPQAVTLECRLGLAGVPTGLDPARMSRVLINLIQNASEAMVGKGDDPSKFTTAAPRITIESRQTARGAEISVADNGPGIPEDFIGRIFEPLFTTKNFGTGLGLPAVQKILEQHGGGLDVSSSPGEGATFTAWWPMAPALQEAV